MFDNNADYTPADKSLWQGRNDVTGPERFFQLVTCIDAMKTEVENSNKPVIIGFCSDEGVKRNQGRTGAQFGPDAIRKQLAKLAKSDTKPFIDIGNIRCQDGNLEQAQQQFAHLLSYVHHRGHKTIALGGGHEIAWAHFCGLRHYAPRLGIINIDAHFDLRITESHKGSSGTPFWQIASLCQQESIPFNYCCLGIQSAANTPSLFTRAKELDVLYLTAEQIHEERLAWQIAFLDDFLLRHEYIYLSICLDAFAECVAPGVSAPQPLGLMPWQVFPLLKYILQTGKVVSMDVAELSPPLDAHEQTARLAASLIAQSFTYFA